MIERQLYQPLIKGAALDGWALFRISDAASGRKPADIAGVAPNGLGVLLEVKQLGDHWLNPDEQAMPWDIFEPSQRGWLSQYAELGAMALVALARGPAVTVYRVAPYSFLPATVLSLYPAEAELTKIRTGLYVGWNRLLLSR